MVAGVEQTVQQARRIIQVQRSRGTVGPKYISLSYLGNQKKKKKKKKNDTGFLVAYIKAKLSVFMWVKKRALFFIILPIRVILLVPLDFSRMHTYLCCEGCRPRPCFELLPLPYSLSGLLSWVYDHGLIYSDLMYGQEWMWSVCVCIFQYVTMHEWAHASAVCMHLYLIICMNVSVHRLCYMRYKYVKELYNGFHCKLFWKIHFDFFHDAL